MSNQTHSHQKTLIVLGPPRSGTSMIAGILEVLGVDMGNLRDSDPENPKGYFEDKDFLSLGDDIYKAANPGSHGFKPPSIESIVKVRDLFEARIRSLLENRSLEAQMRNWGWKTTSTILTINLLIPYLKNPHFVIVLRKTEHIANSIVLYTKRKRLYRQRSKNEALNIIKTYYSAIYKFLYDYREFPRYFVSYEDVINNPNRELEGLARFLNMPVTTTHLLKGRRLVSSRREMTRLKRRFRCKEKVRHIYQTIRSASQNLGRA